MKAPFANHLEPMGAPSFAAEPFSPLDLSGSGLRICLDAMSVAPLSDDDPIASWTDESGNGYHGTNSGGSTRPSKQTVGGLPAIRFNGLNNLFTLTPLSNLITSAAFTAFTVFKATTIDTDGSAGNCYMNRTLWTDAGASYMGLGLRSTGPSLIHYNYDGGYDATESVIDDSNFWISQARHESGFIYSSVNGGSESSAPSGSTPVLTYTLRLAARYDSGVAGYFAGDLRQVVFFNTALSLSNRQKMEGYLAWRWGLQASLPVGHPYVGGPP